MTDTAPRPVTRSRERTRARLIEAAGEVFAEIGLDAASVEEICERAGFTRGAFYSNFASKDELFLELVARLSEQKLALVSARVRELEAEGFGELTAVDIVQRVLDVSVEERLGVLLTSEIRTNAMRNPEFATAYLAWVDGMIQRVSAIVGDITRATGLRLRMPVKDVARQLIMTWETTSANAAIEGLDYDAMCALVAERTSMLAQALVEPRD